MIWIVKYGLLGLILLAIQAAAAQTDDRVEPKFVGALDISQRYSDLGEWAESNLFTIAPPRPFLISTLGPNEDGDVVDADLHQLVPTDFELIETRYEFKEVAVSRKLEDWVRVEINGAPRWIEMTAEDKFSDYLSLIDRAMGYLTSTTITSAEYAGGPTSEMTFSPGRLTKLAYRGDWWPDIEVVEIVSLSSNRLEDDWIKIRILQVSICGEGYEEADNILFEGWIPAYDRQGEPSVWIYPRGC